MRVYFQSFVFVFSLVFSLQSHSSILCAAFTKKPGIVSFREIQAKYSRALTEMIETRGVENPESLRYERAVLVRTGKEFIVVTNRGDVGVKKHRFLIDPSDGTLFGDQASVSQLKFRVTDPVVTESGDRYAVSNPLLFGMDLIDAGRTDVVSKARLHKETNGGDLSLAEMAAKFPQYLDSTSFSFNFTAASFQGFKFLKATLVSRGSDFIVVLDARGEIFDAVEVATGHSIHRLEAVSFKTKVSDALVTKSGDRYVVSNPFLFSITMRPGGRTDVSPKLYEIREKRGGDLSLGEIIVRYPDIIDAMIQRLDIRDENFLGIRFLNARLQSNHYEYIIAVKPDNTVVDVIDTRTNSSVFGMSGIPVRFNTSDTLITTNGTRFSVWNPLLYPLEIKLAEDQ